MDFFSITTNPELTQKLMEITYNKLDSLENFEFNTVVGLETRGFIFGILLAQYYQIPFLPIRKKGKLPGECFTEEYKTEYS